MVHQHFMLVPVFTVAENVVLGHEPTAGAGRISTSRTPRAAGRATSPTGSASDVDPDALVEDLPVGVQQRVEIIKALVPRRRGADPRRADRGAHPAGDRRADRRSCGSSRRPGRRSSSSRTSCARSGPSPTGSPSSAAARSSAARRPDVHRDRARVDDGRPRRQPAGGQGAGGAAASPTLRDHRPDRASTRPACGRSTTLSVEIAPRRDRRARRRAGQRPDRADRGDHRAAHAADRVDHAGRQEPDRPVGARACSTPGVGFVPEDRSTDGVIGDRSPSRRTCPDRLRPSRRTRKGIALDLAAVRRNADEPG